MDSIFKNDWNALSDDLFLPMFNSGKVFNFKRLFSREELTPAVSDSKAAEQSEENVWVKTIDIVGWEPSELELIVTADGKQLMVTGKKEVLEKNEEGGEEYNLRSFKQMIDLPEGIDEEEISSALIKQGRLMITAPYLSTHAATVKQQKNKAENESASTQKKTGRQLLLRQDSKIDKSWNRIFDDFFSPVFESSGLHKNDEFWSDSTALTKHRQHISQTMNNAIAKRFNFHNESRLENWDQVFDEFFFPMFQTNRFFKNKATSSSNSLFSSSAAASDSLSSSKATSVVKTSTKDGPFEREFDLLGYEPSAIQVRVSENGMLTVEAKQELEEKGEGTSFYKLKQYRKTVLMPDNVDVDKITSVLGEHGKLVVTAPLLALETPQGKKERQIAIGRS